MDFLIGSNLINIFTISDEICDGYDSIVLLFNNGYLRINIDANNDELHFTYSKDSSIYIPSTTQVSIINNFCFLNKKLVCYWICKNK